MIIFDAFAKEELVLRWRMDTLFGGDDDDNQR